MGSVFPGMDPYIEGQAWEDFHLRFVGELSSFLVPQVRPGYVVRAERRVYVEHYTEHLPEHIRPDVTIIGDSEQPWQSDRTSTERTETAGSPVLLSVPMPEEIREPYLTIRLRETGEVVTVIEVLSPGNKRPGADGRREYLGKREAVLGSYTHLVELDLLRAGERLPTIEPLPPGDFFAFVCRRGRRPRAEVYAWSLRQPMPIVPVPLAGDDPDAKLDLQAVFTSVYDRSGYDYSLDYGRSPVPPLGDDDAAWAGSLLSAK